MTEFPLLCRSPYCQPPHEPRRTSDLGTGELFTEQTRASVYDYAEHVAVGELVADKGALPGDFIRGDPEGVGEREGGRGVSRRVCRPDGVA